MEAPFECAKPSLAHSSYVSSPISSGHIKLAAYQRAVLAVYLQICKSALLSTFESVLLVDLLQKLSDAYQAEPVPVVLISKDKVVKDCVLLSSPLLLSLKSSILHLCLMPRCSDQREPLSSYLLCHYTGAAIMSLQAKLCQSPVEL